MSNVNSTNKQTNSFLMKKQKTQTRAVVFNQGWQSVKIAALNDTPTFLYELSAHLVTWAELLCKAGVPHCQIYLSPTCFLQTATYRSRKVGLRCGQYLKQYHSLHPIKSKFLNYSCCLITNVRFCVQLKCSTHKAC